MKNYQMDKIRNLALIGGSGAGKTTLCEVMLHNAKATSRVGRVEDGNTVMDFDAEEITRKMSISLALGHLEWEGHLINLVDTPGYPDFVSDLIAGIAAADTVMIVANAAAGFEVGLELAMDQMDNFKGKPRAVLVNRMDSEHADFFKTLADIAENTGVNCAPILIPIGKEAGFEGVVDVVAQKAYIHDKPVDIPAAMASQVEEIRAQLMEIAAETSEELMEKYFEQGELSQEELLNGLKKGITSGDITPAFACSAGTGVGVSSFLWAATAYLPSPACLASMPVEGMDENLVCRQDGEVFAYIFKSYTDPNFGDIAYVRVFSGALKSGLDVFVPEKDDKDRIGNMYYFLGKNRVDASELRAGEIGGLVKLKTARSLSSIVSPGAKFHIKPVPLPTPVYWKTIHAASQADEDKISGALTKLLDEDPTIKSEVRADTHQTVLAGVGEQQLLLIQKRLKNRYKVDTELDTPKIPYKETIQGKADEMYKHKKQTGGRGQYGHVHFRISPRQRGEGFEFLNSIVGGVIPSKFIPAIEKGLNETLEKGIIAGYPVVDICVDCYFGSYHDVDSSEMAFKIASSQCLKNGFKKSNPILLEPIHNVQIVVPVEYMGDVMGDVSTRRGKITGMEQVGKKQILNAQIPLAELFEYFPALKSLTQGRGRFTQTFSHYEKLPNELAEKVMADFKDKDEE